MGMDLPTILYQNALKHKASAIKFDNTNVLPGITATDIQTAIEQLFAGGTSPNLDGGRADTVYFVLVADGGDST